MIIDLNQILSIFNIDYEIVKGNNKLGGASLPKQFNQGGEIQGNFLSRKFSLIYDPDKTKPEWNQVGHKKYAMLFKEEKNRYSLSENRLYISIRLLCIKV